MHLYRDKKDLKFISPLLARPKAAQIYLNAMSLCRSKLNRSLHSGQTVIRGEVEPERRE
jgi:hypothetical protein